ncbi:MAG: hypothetical protein ACQGVC_26325 [Myxococcota bacterium]
MSTATSAHSPDGQAVSARPRWAAKAERGSGAALALLIRIVRSLGPRWSRALVHPVGAYFLLTDREARAASFDYLRRVLPGGAAGWRDGYRHLVEFSTSIFDRMCVWAGQDDDITLLHDGAGHFAHLPDAEGARANRLGKSGALIVGAHLGTFDMMRSICLEAEVPVRVVMYGDNAETINRFFAGLNPGFQLDLIHIKPGAHNATLEIRQAVERGDFVVIMGDRVPLAGEGAETVRFLGGEARFPKGPFTLAALIGCPLMMALAVRVGTATYRVESRPLYAGGRVPRAGRDAVVRDMTLAYASTLEDACRRHPYQWFNFFDFWETKREGS